ncbi:hypothetical protein [Citrobacter freundii]
MLCQQDYYDHKFCIICGSWIYNIEYVSRALPVAQSIQFFIAVTRATHAAYR